MAVRSYYCAVCGIKLSPEQARYGRPTVDSRTMYCPTCAEEGKIDVVRDAPPLSSSHGSGRFKPVESIEAHIAAPLIRARTFPLSSSDEQAGALLLAPKRRSSRKPAAIGIAAVVIALVALLWPGPDKPAPTVMTVEPPAPRAAPPPLRPPVAERPAPVPAAPAPAATAPRPSAAAPIPGSLAAPATSFIGNTRNKKLHKADCKWGLQVSESNRASLRSLEEAMKEGYTTCKECFK